MNYQLLQSELTNDPQQIGYASMTDQEVADSLAAETITTRKMVPIWQVKKLCIEQNVWKTIKDTVNNTDAPVELRYAADAAVSYIEDRRFENLDMDLASTQAMLGALITGGVLSQAQADLINDLADKTTSRAKQIGINDTVTAHQVNNARA